MAAKKTRTRKYGAKTRRTVKKVMHERKHGALRSGGSKKKVKSRKQAIAIALSEARAAGDPVPPRKKASRKKAPGKKASRSSQ